VSRVIEDAPIPTFPEGPRLPDIGRRFDGAVVITRPWQRQALGAPYHLWLDADMNARVDGPIVRFDESVAVSDVEPDTLRRLSIESMSGLTPPILRRVSVTAAIDELQAHAAGGGIYGNGLAQAYGRLAKWQCIAAFADVHHLHYTYPERMPADIIATIMQAAEACAWWRFHDTRWFLMPCPAETGGGFAVLRPEGRTLAVVARADAD
jgi:hypothetical protein